MWDGVELVEDHRPESEARAVARLTAPEREAFVLASLSDLAGAVDGVLRRWAQAMPRRAAKVLAAACEQAREVLGE